MKKGHGTDNVVMAVGLTDGGAMEKVKVVRDGRRIRCGARGRMRDLQNPRKWDRQMLVVVQG